VASQQRRPANAVRAACRGRSELGTRRAAQMSIQPKKETNQRVPAAARSTAAVARRCSAEKQQAPEP